MRLPKRFTAIDRFQADRLFRRCSKMPTVASGYLTCEFRLWPERCRMTKVQRYRPCRRLSTSSPSAPSQRSNLRYRQVFPLPLLTCIKTHTDVTPPEIDLTSLSHAQAVLAQNRIPNESIALIRAYPECPTLFPLDGRTFDVVVCNPPFFSSENEMTQGQDLKADGAHAVSRLL